MSTIVIDNKSYEVKQGKNLLEACLGLGIDLPYFCWHPALGSVGACRQCAVKVYKDEHDTHGKLMMSCMENIKDGLRVSVADKAAQAFRSQVIEWLMTNHPHDCPVCDEGGSCHLQDMTVMTGHDYRRYHFKKRTYNNQYLGPFIHHEMNRCIQCYRCVRYYHDYAGGKDLNVFAAHNHVYFGREQDGVLQSPFSGNLAEICPTGVFTDKTLREHYTRKWDLTTAPSVCQHCSLGCNTIAGERYGQLRCITNRFNSQVNGYFLCDRGRFGYEFVNSENRITQPLIRNQAVEAVDETTLMGHMRKLMTDHTLIGIGSPRASIESNVALMQLVGKENFYQGVSDNVRFIEKRIVEVLQTGVVKTASLQDIQQADAILILGEDIWNTAPVMALAVRQSVLKTAAHHALKHNTGIPTWHDAAVQELVQEEKGFLANCTITASPIDEISSCIAHNAPDDLARLGFAVAHQLNGSLPRVLVDEDTLAEVIDIAVFLQQAKRPVIISGTSCYNEALIRAAYDIAVACKTPDKEVRLAYVMPECNSMGLAMMQAPSFETAVLRATREKNITAIILENDLYRNAPAMVADLFFNSVQHCIVLDSLNNLTTQQADILMPAATFAEGDGTLVNYEGRAQRFFRVFMPGQATIQESWKWLLKLQALRTGVLNEGELHPEDVLKQAEQLLPQFAGISASAPHHDFRINGQALPREPHRYSGRTAMLSNLAVSEPKPKQDNDSPFTFTMEGYSGMPPSPLIPFFWSPGWNSIQAVNKYQQEPGGSLKNEQAGIHLFKYNPHAVPVYFKDIPEAFMIRNDRWLLFPQYHVLGSEELSAYSKGVRELSPETYVAMSASDMARHGLTNEHVVTIKVFEQNWDLPVKADSSLPNGLVLIPAGLHGMAVPNWNAYVIIMKGNR
ncbi:MULTISPECIES: NADH-quinone oxidoreductase subunit NuoG [Niastella]|uniref:NADH-quinone oxidoreductase n=1 Tax=Niastella soli TaxID=2821487 RepID=A0ABS3Z2Y6_9BACT|nr:NADH-quinone oxidoreductase subunit NuoG [Niastella soli]MBO9204533.1 NADH-quinone oxidoreductase subunit NuoG [Niastella soli]